MACAKEEKYLITSLYEECYKTHFRKVVHYSCGYLNDAEAAKDVSHEVFLTVWERREEIDFTMDMLPFLLVLARNRCLNRLRRAQTEYKYMRSAAVEYCRNKVNYRSLSDSPSMQLYSAEITELLRQAVEQMPEKIRETFYMTRQLEMKYAQIAELDNVTVKAVEKRMMVALKILRVKLKDYLP